MRKSLILGTVAVWMAAGLTMAVAADRDASMIDSIGFLAMPDGGAFSATLWGETVLYGSDGSWTFLLGGQYGNVNPHELDDETFWSAGIGLKWYAFPVTSLALKAEYGAYDLADNPNVLMGSAELKQRLAPAAATLSPYIVGSAGIRSAEEFSLARDGRIEQFDDVSAELVVSFGGGVDVAMTEDMVIKLQAVYTESEELFDGWLASAAMTYYWE